MPVLFTLLICCTIGTLKARQPDIDINRIKLLSDEARPYVYLNRNPVENKYRRSNDYDYHSGGFSQPSKEVQYLHGASPVTNKEAIHQPREDPRLFYQSDVYLKEIDRKNMNNEVSLTYPGIEVIRAGDRMYPRRSLPMQARDTSSNEIGSDICVRCPHDRTVIAKQGSEKVVLQYPRLLTCSGKKVPKSVRFVSLFGPKFGALLNEGSHMIIGRITNNNKILQMCKMQVHVIVQNCPLPNYLSSHCDERSKLCTFSCRDPNLELHGHTALSCGDTIGWQGWTGNLPVCRARTWCMSPLPPDHGRMSCKGPTNEKGGLAEGSTCRVRCARGWHWSPRSATVCRRGKWSFNLTCLSKRSYHK